MSRSACRVILLVLALCLAVASPAVAQDASLAPTGGSDPVPPAGAKPIPPSALPPAQPVPPTSGFSPQQQAAASDFCAQGKACMWSDFGYTAFKTVNPGTCDSDYGILYNMNPAGYYNSAKNRCGTRRLHLYLYSGGFYYEVRCIRPGYEDAYITDFTNFIIGGGTC